MKRFYDRYPKTASVDNTLGRSTSKIVIPDFGDFSVSVPKTLSRIRKSNSLLYSDI